MAITVPKYDSPQVQERATPLAQQNANAPIEAFGGGASNAAVFQSAGQLGERLNQVVDQQEAEKNRLIAKEKAKADQTRMLEARRGLWEWERTNIYDPEKGAVNTRGKDALGVSKTLGDSFEKFVEEQSKGLANEDQRAAFQAMAQARRESVYSWAAGHEAQQAKVLEDSEYEASLESSKERGSTDIKNIGIESAFLKQQVGIKAEKEGWGAERIRQELQKQETDLLGRSINGMLAKGNDLQAKGFFEKVKDRMDPDMRSKIEADLEEGSTRGESQRIVDKLLSDYSDLGAAREAIREIKDPKLRDAVDDRAKMEFGLRAQQDNTRRDQNFMQAYSIIEQTQSADQVPPALYNTLAPSQRNALRSLEKQLNQVGPEKHDNAVYLKYLGMPIGQLAKVSEAELIEKVRANVGESYFKEIAHRWEAAREGMIKGNKTKEAEFKSLYSDDELIFNSLKRAEVAGLKPEDSMGKLKGEQAEAVADFREKFNDRLQAFFHQTGKNPNDEQKQKIMRDMLTDRVFLQNSFLGIDSLSKDTQVSGRDLSPADRRRAYVPIEKIPPRSAEALRRQFQSNGKAATADKIQRAYAAAASRDDQLLREILEE